MVLEGKKVMLLFVLLTTVCYPTFELNGSFAQQVFDNNLSVFYTNSSFTIESASPHGNLSFTFGWENIGYIEYNGTLRPYRELRKMTFTDQARRYRMEYWVPVMLFEYIDLDGDDLFTYIYERLFPPSGPDIFVAGYKINIGIDLKNVTVNEEIPVCEWSYTQIAMPMESNIHPPLERFPTVEEVFHYYPLNGTLKMDIVVNNFKPKNDTSRVFLNYGVRYVSLESGKVTVIFDGQELPFDEISQVYPAVSKFIVFKVNGEERGFFDFGGEVTIDQSSSAHLNGSVGPTNSSLYYEAGNWLRIGLNYPHVNRSLIHDPYLGILLRGFGVEFPFTWTIATALVSVSILAIAIVDYWRTRQAFKVRLP